MLGLILFATVSYQSYRDSTTANRGGPVRYFWANLPLDSDPPKPHSEAANGDQSKGSVGWDATMIDRYDRPPSLWIRAFVLSVLPAFAISIAVTRGLGNLGVNEVATFLITMPIISAAWLYFLGRLLDRQMLKRDAAGSRVNRHLS